jgi:hypothetical protein
MYAYIQVDVLYMTCSIKYAYIDHELMHVRYSIILCGNLYTVHAYCLRLQLIAAATESHSTQ